MTHRSMLRRLAVLVTAALAAAGLVAVSAPTAEAASARLIYVYVDANHHVHMTQRMHPGIHEFAIHSAGNASFQLARPHEGYTKADASRDQNASFNQNNMTALRRFERNVSFLGGIASSPGRWSVMFTKLKSGTFWAVDTKTTHLAPSDILTLDVGGRWVGGSLAAPHTLMAVHEHTWAASPAVIPRKGLLKFRNSSVDNHFVVLAKLLPGKTVGDFRRWINKAKMGHDPGSPPANLNGSLDSGVLGPDRSMTFRYKLPSGHYILACF